jgi:hypothetical protein
MVTESAEALHGFQKGSLLRNVRQQFKFQSKSHSTWIGQKKPASQVPKEKYFNQKEGGNSSHPLKGTGLLAA